MTELTNLIRTRAHWEVAVRPEPFQPARLDRGELLPTLHQATVRMRGWPVPYIANKPLLREGAWVGQDFRPTRVPAMEAWRFFTSGQFTQLRVISAELEASTQGQPVLQVWEVLFYMTEVFELASRLALTRAGSQTTTVDVHLKGAAGRTLISDAPGRNLWQDYQAGSNDIHYTVRLNRDHLVAAAREEAVTASVGILWYFGWDIQDPRNLTEYQSQLVEQY